MDTPTRPSRPLARIPCSIFDPPYAAVVVLAKVWKVLIEVIVKNVAEGSTVEELKLDEKLETMLLGRRDDSLVEANVERLGITLVSTSDDSLAEGRKELDGSADEAGALLMKLDASSEELTAGVADERSWLVAEEISGVAVLRKLETNCENDAVGVLASASLVLEAEAEMLSSSELAAAEETRFEDVAASMVVEDGIAAEEAMLEASGGTSELESDAAALKLMIEL